MITGIPSLHRAHGATGASSLFFGHLYFLFIKMNHGMVENYGRGVWGRLRLHKKLKGGLA
jgi:hypothetical protein